MRDWNVHLTRLHILQYIGRLRSYISSLPDSEPAAHSKLIGPEGIKTGAKIADFVLKELGHTPPEMTAQGTSPTMREAREVLESERRRSRPNSTLNARIEREVANEEKAMGKR